MVWVAQGDYVSYYSTEDTKGLFFALFWSLYMSSLIFGDVLGALLITQASGIYFYIIMGSIILVCLVFFLKIEYPAKEIAVLDCTDSDDYFSTELAICSSSQENSAIIDEYSAGKRDDIITSIQGTLF